MLLEPLVATLVTAAFGETLIVGGVLILGAVAALRPRQTTPRPRRSQQAPSFTT